MESNRLSFHGEGAVEKMLGYWHGMEEVAGVRLTLHDHIGAFIMPDRTRLLPDVNVHHFPCCEYRKGSRKRCGAHCRMEAMERAAREGRPFQFCCWRGVTELVMPLFLGKVHAATIFVGAFRDPDFDLSGFSPTYRRLYAAMPAWDEGRRPLLETVLVASGYSLLLLAANLRAQFAEETGRRGQIHRFFLYHFKEPVTVPDLAGELNLSESRTLHLLHELFGKGFSELLNEERVRHVEEYLLNSDYSLREIARMTGFRNEYYLSAVFRRLRRTTPGAVRRNALANPPPRRT